MPSTNRIPNWECPNTKLDLRECLHLLNHFFDQTGLDPKVQTSLQEKPLHLIVDLSEVTLCTLMGTISLSTIISKIISLNSSVHILMPNSDLASGYLSYFGLPVLLARARSAAAVSLDKDNPGPIPKYGKRVFTTRPVFFDSTMASFYHPGNIRNWLNQLSDDVRQTAFFRHGRFARIFTAELCQNMVEHAKMASNQKEGWESFGVAGMRVIKVPNEEKLDWIQSSFDVGLEDFVKEHAHTGFAELCVCDPGIGIRATLESAFSERFRKLYKSDPQECLSPEDHYRRSVEVIQFAFDEFGSSKSEHDRWLMDTHALTSILWLTQTYGGIFSVTTSNACIKYFLDREQLKKD